MLDGDRQPRVQNVALFISKTTVKRDGLGVVKTQYVLRSYRKPAEDIKKLFFLSLGIRLRISQAPHLLEQIEVGLIVQMPFGDILLDELYKTGDVLLRGLVDISHHRSRLFLTLARISCQPAPILTPLNICVLPG